jgi:hypothetical protein
MLRLGTIGVEVPGLAATGLLIKLNTRDFMNTILNF